MASNTPAQPWMACLGGELRGDYCPPEDQAQIALGVWLGDQRQAENQIEAEAS